MPPKNPNRSPLPPPPPPPTREQFVACELRYRDSRSENKQLLNRITLLEDLNQKYAATIERLESEAAASAQRERDLAQPLDESIQSPGNEAIAPREDQALAEENIEGAGVQPAIEMSTLKGELRNLTAALNNHTTVMKDMLAARGAGANRPWWIGVLVKIWDLFASFLANLGAARTSAYWDRKSK